MPSPPPTTRAVGRSRRLRLPRTAPLGRWSGRQKPLRMGRPCCRICAAVSPALSATRRTGSDGTKHRSTCGGVTAMKTKKLFLALGSNAGCVCVSCVLCFCECEMGARTHPLVEPERVGRPQVRHDRHERPPPLGPAARRRACRARRRRLFLPRHPGKAAQGYVLAERVHRDDQVRVVGLQALLERAEALHARQQLLRLAGAGKLAWGGGGKGGGWHHRPDGPRSEPRARTSTGNLGCSLHPRLREEQQGKHEESHRTAKRSAR